MILGYWVNGGMAKGYDFLSEGGADDMVASFFCRRMPCVRLSWSLFGAGCETTCMANLDLDIVFEIYESYRTNASLISRSSTAFFKCICNLWTHAHNMQNTRNIINHTKNYGLKLFNTHELYSMNDDMVVVCAYCIPSQPTLWGCSLRG